MSRMALLCEGGGWGLIPDLPPVLPGCPRVRARPDHPHRLPRPYAPALRAAGIRTGRDPSVDPKEISGTSQNLLPDIKFENRSSLGGGGYKQCLCPHTAFQHSDVFFLCEQMWEILWTIMLCITQHNLFARDHLKRPFTKNPTFAHTRRKFFS